MLRSTKYRHGTLTRTKTMRSIELYGTRVMPLVRDKLGAAVGEVRTGG